MWLIHEDAKKKGRWQVAWSWLPYFLATDRALHKWVGERMTEKFKGSKLEGDVHNMYPPTMTPLLMDMHKEVINLILERYPIQGLRAYLEATVHVQPEEAEEKSDGVAVEG
jgi:hypothetical protein